ncbi:MAG: hypothetical protein KGL53_09170, partial [Elusimicrobia bacterium]|nr:hypothetical protein [Elusimicrobiota bacterium]
MLQALLLAAALAPSPAAAQIEAPSGIRVVVSSAEVTALSCKRRPFSWEDTSVVRDSARGATGGFMHPTDLSSVVESLAATVIMAPMMAVSVPADLVAGPFRRACTFDVTLHGSLKEWAGSTVPGAALELQAMNLLSPEVPNVRAPKWAEEKVKTVSD